jgi:hypothetical protein
MANNINISDLTLDGIKTSLVDYLKSQSTLKDFNFEGSAIRTIVDLLAYNTLYYGYYANMMANEMFLDTAKLEDSIISLTKPLGYVVQKYKSAKALIRFTNIQNEIDEIPIFTVFSGNSSIGTRYFFYNIEAIPVLTNTSGTRVTDTFEVYEGKALSRRVLVNVDLNTQTISLNNLAIDPRTIVVEVKDTPAGDSPFKVWTNYNNFPETVIKNDTEVFYIERTKRGYNINFGKQTSTDISTPSSGKLITSQNRVYVSYLISSGQNANNISSISTTALGTVTSNTVKSSNGGASSPDLDSIRFFAPKTFARQNRLVTKNDYYSMLDAELGNETSSGADYDYTVFGGEEATPPVYGRVFVSLADLNPTTNSADLTRINQIMSILKTKSVVSILPEFVPEEKHTMNLSITANLPNSTTTQRNTTKTQLISAFNSQIYPKAKYKAVISKTNIISVFKSVSPNLQIQTSNIVMNINSSVYSDVLNGKIINFKNPIKNVSLIPSDNGFTTTVQGKYIFASGIINDVIGEVDLSKGLIIIYPNTVSASSISAKAEISDDTYYGKDQIKLSQINLDLTVLA